MQKSRRAISETGAQDATRNGDSRGTGGFDLPAAGGPSVVRTTIVLTTETDLNLDLCRFKLGVTRNEVIKRAIHSFLIQEGFDPSRSPKNVGVSY